MRFLRESDTWIPPEIGLYFSHHITQEDFKMMYRMSLILALILSLLLIGCASQQIESREPKEPLHGTWENRDYAKPVHDPEEAAFNIIYPSQIVFTPDGKFTPRGVLAQALGVTPYRITSKWTDSEGNLWYKVVIKFEGEVYLLIKVDSSNKILELSTSPDDYPTEIDMKRHPTDRIYYRKK